MHTIWFLFVTVLSLIVVSPQLLFYKLKLRGQKVKTISPAQEWLIQGWARMLMKVAGFRVERSGEENAAVGPALYVGNHQGLFDIAIAMVGLGGLKPILAKIEAKKIPMIHGWMDSFDCIFIDRGNVRQSLECLNRAQELLEAGKSVVIFPEGTRSRGGEMHEMKAGSFRCAIKAGVPIVPFAIEGSYHGWEERKGVHSTRCRLSILPPIETAGMDKARTKTIAEEVQGIIAVEVERLKQESVSAN